MKSKDHNIFVSEAAKKQIKIKLAKTQAPYLRLGVRGGGCNGFKYVIQFEYEAFEKDVVIDIGGIQLLVDPKSLLYLNGATLDWEESLIGKGFKFVNPLEQSKCGCGLSVSLKKEQS